MPWTPKQTRFLLSKGSPLTADQQQKMKQELQDNPAMAHGKKGALHSPKPEHKMGHMAKVHKAMRIEHAGYSANHESHIPNHEGAVAPHPRGSTLASQIQNTSNPTRQTGRKVVDLDNDNM